MRKKGVIGLIVTVLVSALLAGCASPLAGPLIGTASADEGTETTKVVRHIPTGDYVYREVPDFEDGKGIINAVSMFGYDPADLEEIVITIAEWEAYQAQELAENLPMSRHIAALKNVYNNAQGRPRADVYRKYLGNVYEVVGCRVSQTAYNHYMAGDLKLYNSAYDWLAPENEDCFVAIDYIHENFEGEDQVLTFITDKLMR